MTYAWLIAVFFLYSYIFFAKAENCLVYNFDYDVDSLVGNDKQICSGMQSWTVGNYSTIGMESFNSESDSFLSANTALSCGSTFEFQMESGGVVEVNVYIGEGNLNQFTILAFQSLSGNNDVVLGTTSVFYGAADFTSGWQTLRFALSTTGSFNGYLTLIGMASQDSEVLVDSFKYIPPGVTNCDISEEDAATTTEKADDDHEECVTYNFESEFDIRFTTNNYLCSGFLPWHLRNYTDVDIESPNPSSTVFMTPNEFSSCISSFVFKMSPEGIVEANVYMEPVTALDHIIVLAQRVTEKEYDTVAGFKMYYPENHVFVSGWNVLRFSLLDLTSFEGYLIFIGSADKDSTVLIDSVRYIPPDATPEDDSCVLYKK